MVVKHTTENGLTVLLEPIEGVVSISAGLWVKAGSRHEKAGQHGYAHFIEHMLFKGTENYTAREIARLVDRVGGQHNAATNREYTCYYINVISDHLELTIEILADMYYRSLFDEAEIDKEKKVILEEIRMYEDTPDELVHDHFIESVLAEHPLGHSIIGDESSIAGVTRKKLVDFFNGYYLNNNCIFVIAGKFDVDDAKRLIDTYFTSGGKKSEPDGSITDLSKRIYRRHVQRDLEQVHFCLGGEGVNKNDDDRWALYALSTLFGGSMSSRLFQNIREKEGLCYSIYSFHSSYADKGIFGIYCGTSPENFERVMDLIQKESRALLENGITETELLDTKTYIKGNIALSMESTEVRMGQLARNEMNFGRYVPFEEIVDNINLVTLDDVMRVARRLLREQELSLVSIGKLADEGRAARSIRL
ncbi:MAG: insulinase family protein [Spirochaetes bacterium]|nr:insulinase family protein [Spirochaetota bacterium]HPA70887.1 pitrilysin family protein [Spirochaetota bacterium]